MNGKYNKKMRRTSNIEEVIKKLSPILNIKDEFLLDRFKNNNSGIELANELTANQAKKIKNLNISGLDLVKYSQRYYPQRNLYSNLIGFVYYEN